MGIFQNALGLFVPLSSTERTEAEITQFSDLNEKFSNFGPRTMRLNLFKHFDEVYRIVQGTCLNKTCLWIAKQASQTNGTGLSQVIPTNYSLMDIEKWISRLFWKYPCHWKTTRLRVWGPVSTSYKSKESFLFWCCAGECKKYSNYVVQVNALWFILSGSYVAWGPVGCNFAPAPVVRKQIDILTILY